MDDGEELRSCIQDALDELCSPRTTLDAKTRALDRLEEQIATSCLAASNYQGPEGSWDSFLALQYTFECNIPSRLISWISASTPKLEQAAGTGTSEERTLTLQMAKGLSLIQGIGLSHESSKSYLSRKYCLEVLLDLLLTSRHLTSSKKDEPSASTPNKQPGELPLTSSVLDTLLCILVDSPSALRVFESARGVESVVKILKRANTLRVVRMKCLEFLYFYLLDETDGLVPTPRSPSMTPNGYSYPGTPSLRLPLTKPSLHSTPRRPHHVRHGSRSSEMSSSSSSSSRSNSSGSTQSFTSISSVSTPASLKSSPTEKPMRLSQPSFKASFQAPSAFKFPACQPEQRMMMFKREVDYEPLSPTKSQFGTPNSRPRSRTHSQLYTPSRRSTQSSNFSISFRDSESFSGVLDERRKTTEEKKRHLGTMLGNIDALVEGVEKAGIWGLG
ncbi:hypothetical protein AGABI1DRAFT_113218 [Agaricus bisporus var. burnettii JB137-S8]|uniref:Cell division control protein 14 n=1 Tax=Agaricus bisporus var. burnettii (strain JB137-S8 / ATCC MYA-4627 / FGSC 10392) TaxID=597362 RepID=K5VZM6_AGABU|nr:uncharacterized protein AGABI1DRAFT_113218 [Agaricus bisporus var. burnettii JB137-S8]EKM79974.1 hypothetical protein AGABI1DRAFT_113218 [Agaricus bisporus var. burnettii JB137-S8]